MQPPDIHFREFYGLVEARRGHELIGWAELETEKGARRPNCCWLLGIQVLSEQQRRGYGTVLLKRVEQLASEHGCDCLALNSVADALPFYTKQGYGKTGSSLLLEKQL